MLKVGDIPEQVLRDICGAYHRRLAMMDTESQSEEDRDFQRAAYLRTALEWLAVWISQYPMPAAPAVPDGLKLVPDDPTEEMLIRGGSIAVQTSGTWYCVAREVYKAMLAAAPV